MSHDIVSNINVSILYLVLVSVILKVVHDGPPGPDLLIICLTRTEQVDTIHLCSNMGLTPLKRIRPQHIKS